MSADAMNPPPCPADVSVVELLREAKPATLAALQSEFIPLVGGGIVNPFGPTLQLIAAVGEWRPGLELPIIWAILNPFSQVIQQIGVLKLRALVSPAEVLAAVVPKEPGGCPTALIASPLAQGRPADLVSGMAGYVAACEGVRDTLDRVRKFPGDPRSRVQDELANAMKAMKQRRNGEPVTTDSDLALTTLEAGEFVQIQLEREHWINEWQAFVDCWWESITRAPPMAPVVNPLPFTDIEPIFQRVTDMSAATLSATFPHWHQKGSHESR